MKSVKLYDTTLRDGTQGEGISLSVHDKLRIAERLDAFGIHYIEGGWPGSNPKDMEFFTKVREAGLKNAKVAAFGSTRRPGVKAEDDFNLKHLLKAQTDVVTLFGKSWDFHVKDALKTTLDENLNMIRETVGYLKSKKKEVVYDAEHFFDGCLANEEYALQTIQAAAESGADTIALCDTNGGMLPGQIRELVAKARQKVRVPLGIHVHNDGGMAVANSLVAVEAGCEQVQGTINGCGERCGNADLVVLIPNLKLKLGVECVSDKALASLTEMAHYVAEIVNMILPGSHPYVGHSAFAHKGGVHVDAMMKHAKTYEHVDPVRVGNIRRFLISELSGKTNILIKAKEMQVDLDKKNPETREILEKLQDLEHQGYHFEGAEASFDVLMKKMLKKHRAFFKLEGFRVAVEKHADSSVTSEATIKVNVDGREEHTAAEGEGPVNALDHALRKALKSFYPQIADMHLTDYKVRVLDAKAGTAAKVRVFIESSDQEGTWSTVGVSENIIEASWQALVDAIEYKLLKTKSK
ncbi:MAG: citramalate synthase [Candidatus Omnitrophica bacterium]|nr:citramalate synthase [Candidatus Omnitrophota bacterium]